MTLTARAISEYVRTTFAIFFFTSGTRRYTCFSRYFPNVDEIEKYDWIRDPFDEELTKNLSMKEREECAEYGPHTQTEIHTVNLPLDQFWLTCRIPNYLWQCDKATPSVPHNLRVRAGILYFGAQKKAGRASVLNMICGWHWHSLLYPHG